MRTKPKITFNGGAIKGTALQAFQTTMIELGEACQTYNSDFFEKDYPRL